MSSPSLSPRRLAPVTPLRTTRRKDSPTIRREREGVEEAGRLLPGAMLQGCREAIQRLGDVELPSYGITSAIRGEGRSSIALGFALVEWLDHERRTVLVDLDLEQPTLHRRLGLRPGPGIDELVDPGANVEDHLQRAVGEVWLLSVAGTADDAPRALIRLAQSPILSQISEWAEAVVFDLPPLLASPTGLEAARLGPKPVMVVRAGITPMPRVKEAVDALPDRPPVILNGVWSAVPSWLRHALGDWK